MRTLTVSKTEFKPKAFEYLRRVAAKAETIRITDHGRPVAEVVACGHSSRSALERMRGLVQHFDKPLEPVDEAWDAEA